MNSKFEGAGIVAAILGFIALLVFNPVITFGFAYLGGLILKLCVGDVIAGGMNLIFNTTRFTPDIIPQPRWLWSV